MQNSILTFIYTIIIAIIHAIIIAIIIMPFIAIICDLLNNARSSCRELASDVYWHISYIAIFTVY